MIRFAREGDFGWAVIKHKPDYFIYSTKFNGWMETIIDKRWFHESYKQIIEMNQSDYPCVLKIFKKVLSPDFKRTGDLIIDSFQDESDFAVGTNLKKC